MSANSKEKYFQTFLDFLNNSAKDNITLSLDEVREKLGVDEKGKNVLCKTPNKNREFWSYNTQHRFPYFLGNNGWKCSSHYSGNIKEITFYKAEIKSQRNKSRKQEVREPVDLNKNSLLSLGKLYKDYEDIISKKNKEYPPMKFLDMAFFRESYDGKKDDEETDEK